MHASHGMFAGVSVAIMFNGALTDVEALSGLTSINGDLVISGNSQLESLAPLSRVRGERGSGEEDLVDMQI